MDFNSHGREKFEYILDNIPDAITIVDNYGKVIFFNSTAEEYFNLKKSDIIDKDLVEFFPNAILLRVLDSRTSFNNIYNSPRENSFVVSSAVPLYDREGKMIGALARDRDITEIVRLSELLNKTRSNLLRLEQEYSKMSSAGEAYFSKIVSNNAAFIEIINLCKNISKTPLNILLRGESGTGKELFANSIHAQSSRSHKNFVRVNCAALSDSLLESELFGYDEGSFTGALKGGKKGLFEEANKGTIFLDEETLGFVVVGDRCRVINGYGFFARFLFGFIERAGHNGHCPGYAALSKAIKEGNFREDLFYRLSILPIYIPPLRDRKEDIPLLVKSFIAKFNDEYGRNIVDISEEALRILQSHDWPGNVRELENTIGRAIIYMNINEKVIDTIHLPHFNKKKSPVDDRVIAYEEADSLESVLSKTEAEYIKKLYYKLDKNKTRTAKELGISIRSLYYKMEKYGIS